MFLQPKDTYFCVVQEFITYKNSRIAFSSEGKGSAIVLLHGFLENSSMWNNIIPKILKRNRIICIDLLGHGKSNCFGYVHTMDEMAEAVKAVLKHLKIRRVTLIGHSMGGYVSLAFAEKFPKNVKKICLLNSTAQADSDERKKLRKRAIQLAQTNYNNLVSMSITNLFAEHTRKQFLNEIEIVKNEALKTSLQGYIACTEGMQLRPNREHVLNTASYKKLFILGKNDSILNYKSVIKEANRTNTPFVELSSGHMSHIENLEDLVLILNDFLRH